MRTVRLTTLMDQATELLADLARDRKPILVTRHGLPSACLVDAETYRAMQERLSILEGIARASRRLPKAGQSPKRRQGDAWQGGSTRLVRTLAK